MRLGTIDYSSDTSPAAYCCAKCSAGGRKLWRQSNTFADHIALLCVDCALVDQRKCGHVGEDGRREGRGEEDGYRSDQIGWLVPAVPTEDGESFWGYSSVPAAGCIWWRGLPLRERVAPPPGELNERQKATIEQVGLLISLLGYDVKGLAHMLAEPTESNGTPREAQRRTIDDVLGRIDQASALLQAMQVAPGREARPRRPRRR